jgi:outer membrane protein assembly factor BamE (lipoprotein component of BamABCDE complex)
MRGKLILAAGLAASTTLMSGCLVAGSSRTYQSGTYVGRGTLAQIEPGKTNEEFVLASLGPPTSKITMDDGAELWKWEYTRRRSSSGAVFLLLASDTHHESRTVTYILFRDRIVERVWQD